MRRRGVSVLNDPEMVKKFGWAPVAARRVARPALLDPRDPIWATLELQLRSAHIAGLLGQKTAKEALDERGQPTGSAACAARGSAR